MYGLEEPLICAWKAELTLIIMLSETESFTTHLTVLCSVASYYNYTRRLQEVVGLSSLFESGKRSARHGDYHKNKISVELAL